jgi:CMP-N,N'-diacetyllegionaminic acid synthase
MKVLAVIPGRAGSKGVPGKNSKVFDGKPLIGYAIEAALESKLITDIVVSSDGEQILKIASSYESVQCHNRRNDLATDSSPIGDTLVEIINQFEERPEFIVLLQPTSPLRTGQQIDEAIGLLSAASNCNSVISVIRMDDVHPARMYWMEKDSEPMKPIIQEFETARRQDIPPAFYRNGAIYVTRVPQFLETKSVMTGPSCGYEMSGQTWLNIDDKRDVIIAESLIKAWKAGEIE